MDSEIESTILTSSDDITGNERIHDLSAAADHFRDLGNGC